MHEQLLGIHVRIFHNYRSYSTVVLSKGGKARIWLAPHNIPNETAVQVCCAKCGKEYFIKYKKPKKTWK